MSKLAGCLSDKRSMGEMTLNVKTIVFMLVIGFLDG